MRIIDISTKILHALRRFLLHPPSQGCGVAVPAMIHGRGARATRVAIVAFMMIFISLWGLRSAGGEENKKPASTRARYSPGAWHDPFKPFLETDALWRREQQKLQVMPLSPLLRSPVSNFRLLGIIGDHNNRMAVVEDGDGRFYTLLPGSDIGNRNGRVVSIHRDHLIVEERLKGAAGRERWETIKIKFYKEALEGKP